jgi:hypothetical protein
MLQVVGFSSFGPYVAVDVHLFCDFLNSYLNEYCSARGRDAPHVSLCDAEFIAFGLAESASRSGTAR